MLSGRNSTAQVITNLRYVSRTRIADLSGCRSGSEVRAVHRHSSLFFLRSFSFSDETDVIRSLSDSRFRTAPANGESPKRRKTARPAGTASVARAGQRQFHPAVLRLAIGRVVRGHRVRIAETLRRDQGGIDSLGNHELHHVVGPLL